MRKPAFAKRETVWTSETVPSDRAQLKTKQRAWTSWVNVLPCVNTTLFSGMWIREMWGGRCARLLWGRCRRRRHDRRGHVHDQYGHALKEATHRVESVKFQFSARPMQRGSRTSRKPFSDKKLAHFWLFFTRIPADPQPPPPGGKGGVIYRTGAARRPGEGGGDLSRVQAGDGDAAELASSMRCHHAAGTAERKGWKPAGGETAGSAGRLDA